MTYPEPKGDPGNKACQQTAGRVQALGTVLWGTRVIWRKLNCLKPNLQLMELRVRRKDVCNRRRALPRIGSRIGHLRGTGAMPSEGIQGDEWAAYVTLDTYIQDVPRDRLKGESPRVTECQ